MDTLENNIQTVCTLLSNIRQAIGEKVEVSGHTAADYPNLIRQIDNTTIPDYKQWLVYGGLVQSSYNSLSELLASNDFDILLNIQKSASYAAYISNTISSAIKSNNSYLIKVLSCPYSKMFYDSQLGYYNDETIKNLCDINPTVTTSEQTIVQCSSERAEVGYYAYMAFNGSLDTPVDPSEPVTFDERGVWSAYGKNQWVQYYYNNAKKLAFVDFYPLRDNAPTGVKIEGSLNGEDFVIIKDKVGFQWDDNFKNTDFNRVWIGSENLYKYFRFTILGSYYGDFSCAGEIQIFTFKE